MNNEGREDFISIIQGSLLMTNHRFAFHPTRHYCFLQRIFIEPIYKGFATTYSKVANLSNCVEALQGNKMSPTPENNSQFREKRRAQAG